MLRHLADRVATPPAGEIAAGRTVTARVRFADLRSVTRSFTLDAPISATASLAEIAEELVRAALADHPCEKLISLLAISVSHLENHWICSLSFHLNLKRAAPARQQARAGALDADRAVDKFANGSDGSGWIWSGDRACHSVPDAFRELAEKISSVRDNLRTPLPSRGAQSPPARWRKR